MYSEDKIIQTLGLVTDTCFDALNSVERLMVISNLLLKEAEGYLPPELKEGSQHLLSNGKRINYELIKFENNLGLNLAIKAHLIISLLNENLESTND